MVRLRLLDGGLESEELRGHGSPSTTSTDPGGVPGPAASAVITQVLSWVKRGWFVVPTHAPVRYGDRVGCSCRLGPDCTQVAKHPRTKSGITDATRDPQQVRAWWRRWPDAGIAGAASLALTGSTIDLVAVDLDAGKYTPEDEQWLDGYLQRHPTRVHRTGGGGRHLIWIAHPGSRIKSGQNVHGHRGVDLRVGRQSYILLPPSSHASGQRYSVIDDREPAPCDPELEQWLTGRTARPGATGGTAGTPGNGNKRKPKAETYNVHSLLTDLLSNPDHSGRNVWLTAVAGHYAKRFRGQQDAYQWHVEAANQLCDPPLEDTELSKVAESVWKTENTNHPERGLADSNGYLQAVGRDSDRWPALLTSVRRNDGEEQVDEVEVFGDFVPEVLGVNHDPSTHTLSYWIRLHRQPDAGQPVEVVLEGSMLGDGRALTKWLASYGCTLSPPKNRHPGTLTVEAQLQRYLLSQQAAVCRLTDVIGWDPLAAGGGGFVTPAEVLTADGPVTFEQAGVRLNPEVIRTAGATYRYGTRGGLVEARSVLNAVLEFQADHVVSVFGSWWAACLVKPQLLEALSLFPICAIEAPSESGKTNGFFGLMIQLNGNTGGAVVATTPSLRNQAAHSRSGIVWVDDADRVDGYLELVRSATSAGTFTKMGADRSTVESFRVEAPLVFSGEGLGLRDQKALADRAVLLDDVPSPKGRTSADGSGRNQWEDVKALKARYAPVGGLSAVAGSLQVEALRVAGAVVQYAEAVRKTDLKSTGRRRDTYAALLAGAWLLETLLSLDAGNDVHTGLVRAWIAEQDASFVGDADNSLTQALAPWALRTFQYPEAAEENGLGGRYVGMDVPAWVERATDGTEVVWVSVELLAQAWELHRGSRVSQRTETADALRGQAQATGAKSVRKKIVGGQGRRAYYYRLPPAYSVAVLRRARGGS